MELTDWDIQIDTHVIFIPKYRVLKLGPKLLESIIDCLPLQHCLLNLIIHSNQLRHNLQHLIQQLTWNSHNPLQWITEDNITLLLLTIYHHRHHACAKHTGFTVTPPTSTGTFLNPGFASAPLPTVEVPCAQTGNPHPVISPKSLTRPFTTAPFTPRYFIRTAMMPPRTAQFWEWGWSMTAIVLGFAWSTQWVPLGNLCSGEDSRRATSGGKDVVVLGMNLKVLAGAIILGEVLFRPRVGEKGAFCGFG